ncbi:glycoside hydrolase [Dendryphion nanum]|uniref:lytic cellulose monooxygenase (C4-dehydrogenating) n=1 Tax=Dendryphion nanum TaxID=256645 RepID=A0A9P9IE60_9PLEO|nr:glycoside hydrolase [Dendryphion nanum]
MRLRFSWIGLLLSTTQVFAHYTFEYISVNGGPKSKAGQYTRTLTKEYDPYYDIYDDNIRCGRGAATRGAGIETLSINAGDEIAFIATLYNTAITIFHEGPGLAYLSKSDGPLEYYTGDGDWFKIAEHTSNSTGKWALQFKPSMNFKIPKTTPPGKYLLRAEHIFPYDSSFNRTQFYLSCAHLDIKGPGGGTPGPMVKFPGAYDLFDRDVSDYVAPGPPVWKG